MTHRLKFWFLAAALGILPLFLLGFAARATASAGLWYVAPGGDDNADCQTTLTPCATINAAIGMAAPGDTIDVAIGTYTAPSVTEVLLITQSVTLLGGWNSGFTTQNGLSTVDGQGARRGMTISGSATVTVERFLVQNGLGNGGTGGIYNGATLTLNHSIVTGNTGGDGGGIFNGNTMTLNNSIVSGNTAWYGGGISNGAIMTLNNSTVSGNTSNCWGGGIDNNGIATLTLNNSSVSDNISQHESWCTGLFPHNGGGIDNYSTLILNSSTVSGNSERDQYGNGIGGIFNAGTATLQNSILAGNTGSTGPDCNGNVGSVGYNLIGVISGCNFTHTSGDIIGADPELGPLQSNGGPAPTQALLAGSPAVNAGNPGGCLGSNGLLATDERGYPRQGRCDIGAFEAQPLDNSDKTVSQHSAVPGQAVRFTVSVANSGASPMAGVTVTDTLPAGLSFVNGSLTTTGGSAIYSAGVITWTGSVNAGASVTINYAAASLPNTSFGTVITNAAMINGNGESFTRQASFTVERSKLFLPAILKPQPGIWGNVTVNGSPAGGIFLELRRFDGQNFSTQASTTTGPAGYYIFNPPSLPPGQFYYVRYLNTSNTLGLLSYWATAKINSFTAGASVGAGNFDLADITMSSPNPGAVVSLPALFQWVRRPATPTDSYQLSLFDPNGSAFGQTNLLGYVNGINLTSVPSDFHSGTTYGWYVAVNSPGGGYGESYYYRRVTFNNVLAPSQPAGADGATVLPARPPVDGARR